MLFGVLFSSLLVFELGSGSAIPDSKLIAERTQHGEGGGQGWGKGVEWGHSKNSGSQEGSNGGWSRRDCQHGPASRSCWGAYSVETDSEEQWPDTGKTVHYKLNICNQTLSPDGTPRSMLVINGQYPGPVLTAGKFERHGN